mmetsp:Transcript_9011/g.24257  ORF Transcript_9011/g.24257 Transcript_9011/m.24257 type:complete len:97 (-) Transcript_9011:1615-1905(-)
MQVTSEGEIMKQESEANGVACRERHRRVDPLPIEARKKEVERLQGIIQKLRREAVTSRNKAEQEIKVPLLLGLNWMGLIWLAYVCTNALNSLLLER